MGTPDLGPSITSTQVDLSERLLWPSRGLWTLLAGGAVLGTVLGAGARFDQVVQPCVGEDPCSLGQFRAEELAALTTAGLSVEALSIYLVAFSLALVAICSVAGFLIFWPRPRTLIAFVASLFLIFVACSATFIPLSWSDAWSFGAVAAAALSSLTNLCIVAFFVLFPTGTFAPRSSAAVLVGWLAYEMASLVQPSAPWSLRALPPGGDFVPVMLAIVLAGGFQVVRYRRHSTPVERQQTKWVSYALALQGLYFVLAILITFVWSPNLDADWGNYFFHAGIFHGWVLTFLMIPLTLFFSIQRYRLWDIDLLVHRSLVYAFSTFLVALGFGVMLFLGETFISLFASGKHHGLAVGAALLGSGALFQPCRRAMRGFVDRRFFGIHVDVHRPETALPTGPTGPGFPLSGYSDIELVGAGGMARVYQARRDEDGKIVAIKMRRWEEDSNEVVSRFEREASIIGELDHPNIVRLLDYCVVGERFQAIIMDFVSDTTLRQAIDGDEPLPTERVLELLHDITLALDYAHEKDVIHRDVKPSNVLLAPVAGSASKAVLTDFGIAKVGGRTRLTVTNPIGTVTHMSPEQIQTPHQVDRRSDVYSLGILAYQMLTGDVPFGGGNATAILIAHLQQPAPDPRTRKSSVSAQAAAAVCRALSKRPADRYETAGDFYLGLLGRGPSEAVTRVH